MYPVDGYLNKETLANTINHSARETINDERPQLLMENGKPRYLYVNSGCRGFGGEIPVRYIVKYN